jgi:hypothetical protein
MLDELALRRPDFLGGIPIRLADGQTWMFPVPVRPNADPVGSLAETESVIALFGPEYLHTLRAVMEAQDEAERMMAELALAIDLLSRNYRLSPEMFRELLEGPQVDADIRHMKNAFHSMATTHLRAAFDLDRDEPRPAVADHCDPAELA